MKDKQIFYVNDDFALAVTCDSIEFISSRKGNGLLSRRGLKNNKKIETRDHTQFLKTPPFIFADIAEDESEIRKWGVTAMSSIKKGSVHNGTVMDVQKFGVRIAIGHNMIGRCQFKNVTEGFMPKEKTMEICQKYFEKGEFIYNY